MRKIKFLHESCRYNCVGSKKCILFYPSLCGLKDIKLKQRCCSELGDAFVWMLGWDAIALLSTACIWFCELLSDVVVSKQVVGLRIAPSVVIPFIRGK